MTLLQINKYTAINPSQIAKIERATFENRDDDVEITLHITLMDGELHATDVKYPTEESLQEHLKQIVAIVNGAA